MLNQIHLVGLFTGARPVRNRQDAEENPDWFPWSNKVVSVAFYSSASYLMFN